VRVKTDSTRAEFDAVGIDSQSEKILFAIEVKSFVFMNKRSLERLAEVSRMLPSNTDYPIFVIAVYGRLSGITENDLHLFEQKGSSKSNNRGFVFYKSNPDGKLKPTDEHALNNLLPSQFVPF